MRLIRSHAGLRGVAALLVVFYHLQYGGPHLAIEDATLFFRRSYLMVDLFFILSGFIISHVNDADRATPMRGAEVRDFLLRRMIRLYPLHIACLAAMAVFAGVWALAFGRLPYWAESGRTLATQVLLLNAWIGGSKGWNIPSWSISAEIAAYALFPLTMRAGVMPGLRLAATVAVPLGFYGWVMAGGGSLDITAGLAPLRAVAGFCVGCLLHRGRHGAQRIAPSRLGAIQVISIIVIAAGLVWPVADPLLIAPFATLIWSSWTDRGAVAALLAKPVFVKLGDLSYSIYLTHVPIAAIGGLFWSRFLVRVAVDPTIGRIAWIVLYLAAVLIASRLTFARIEVPARRWLTARITGQQAKPIAASPPAP